jgi:hypothetical protein
MMANIFYDARCPICGDIFISIGLNDADCVQGHLIPVDTCPNCGGTRLNKTCHCTPNPRTGRFKTYPSRFSKSHDFKLRRAAQRSGA